MRSWENMQIREHDLGALRYKRMARETDDLREMARLLPLYHLLIYSDPR